jgi:hypothetical protein
MPERPGSTLAAFAVMVSAKAITAVFVGDESLRPFFQRIIDEEDPSVSLVPAGSAPFDDDVVVVGSGQLSPLVVSTKASDPQVPLLVVVPFSSPSLTRWAAAAGATACYALDTPGGRLTTALRRLLSSAGGSGLAAGRSVAAAEPLASRRFSHE